MEKFDVRLCLNFEVAGFFLIWVFFLRMSIYFCLLIEHAAFVLVSLVICLRYRSILLHESLFCLSSIADSVLTIRAVRMFEY